MITETKEISPVVAKYLLENNFNNRNISQSRVHMYANDMRNGNWQLNGETIKVYSDGTLADGQHRLAAIIEAGIPVTMTVMYDIDKSVKIFDTGKNRNVSDILKLSGYEGCLSKPLIPSAIRRHYRYQFYKHNPTTFEIEDFINRNADDLKKTYNLLSSAHSHTRHNFNIQTSTFFLVVFYAIKSGYDEGFLLSFLKSVSTGLYNSQSEQAAIIVRNDLTTKRDKSVAPEVWKKREILMLEKAIDDYMNGYPRKISYGHISAPTFSKTDQCRKC